MHLNRLLRGDRRPKGGDCRATSVSGQASAGEAWIAENRLSVDGHAAMTGVVGRRTGMLVNLLLLNAYDAEDALQRLNYVGCVVYVGYEDFPAPEDVWY